MPRLKTFQDTVMHVKYSHDAEEVLAVTVTSNYAYYKNITVLFHGPVESEDTGTIYNHAASVTLERINEERIWNVTLGTPIDSYENERDIPEEEIPENITQAVNLFIETFEK